MDTLFAIGLLIAAALVVGVVEALLVALLDRLERSIRGDARRTWHNRHPDAFSHG